MKNSNEYKELFSGVTPFKGYGEACDESPRPNYPKPVHPEVNPEDFSEKVDPAFRGMSDFAGCGTGGEYKPLPKTASDHRLSHFD